MKQLRFFGLLCWMCISCEYMPNTVVTEETIVANEKKSIDLDSVDEFPAFENCLSVETSQRRTCFFETLTLHISERLAAHNLTVTRTIQDTIRVSLKIDSTGTIKATEIHKNQFTTEQLPSLDSLLVTDISTLPKVLPATKRGIPVTTKFVLPIVLHVKE